MKGEDNRSQHYIPKCYLKGFSENKKSIYLYSKTLHKSHSQSISKTACIDFFYTIPEKYISTLSSEDFDKNFFEKEFFDKNVENKFSLLLNSINDKAAIWRINKNQFEILSKSEKEIFAALIGIQYLRMPNIREKYSLFHQKRNAAHLEIMKSFLSNQCSLEKKFIDSIKINIDENYKPVEHSEIFADQEWVDDIQNQILNKIWIYYVSSQSDFYTSDNPILVKPHLQNQYVIYEGFGMKGAEIIFPLGSKVLLTLWDKEYFKDKKFQDNQFVPMDEKLLREYNCYQYIWSNNEIYSMTNDFNLIEQLKIANNGDEIFKNKQKILVNGNN